MRPLCSKLLYVFTKTLHHFSKAWFSNSSKNNNISFEFLSLKVWNQMMTSFVKFFFFLHEFNKLCNVILGKEIWVIGHEWKDNNRNNWFLFCGKESTCQVGDTGSIPGLGRSLGNEIFYGRWQSTPVFLPGKSNGQRSLESYSPRGHKQTLLSHWTAKLPLLQRGCEASKHLLVWKESHTGAVETASLCSSPKGSDGPSPTLWNLNARL